MFLFFLSIIIWHVYRDFILFYVFNALFLYICQIVIYKKYKCLLTRNDGDSVLKIIFRTHLLITGNEGSLNNRNERINEPILYIYIYLRMFHYIYMKPRFHINLMLIFGPKIWKDMLTKGERTSTTTRTSYWWLVKRDIGRHESSRHYTYTHE